MTQKDLIKIASDERAMDLLREIAMIQSNMCHKTIYEKKSAKQKMHRMAKEIIEGLEA
jgi:hypothetical protein